MEEENLREVFERIPCRGQQIIQLAALLDPSIPKQSTIVLHGTTATAKSLTVKTLLPTLELPHTIVKSRECITGRHLLERAVLAVRSSLTRSGCIDSSTNPAGLLPSDSRVESISALQTHLSSLLSAAAQRCSRFVLVFDGIDKQREAPATLLPALARLGSLISTLTVVMIVTSPRPRYFHTPGVPHIEFPAYGREQMLEVLALRAPEILFDDPADGLLPSSAAAGATSSDAAGSAVSLHQISNAEDNRWLWTRFCGAVLDSLGRGGAGDVVSVRRLADRLWPAFVAPVRRSEYGSRDFARLMVRNRALFQSEAGLQESLLAPETLTEQDFDNELLGGGKKSTSAAAKKAAATASSRLGKRKRAATGPSGTQQTAAAAPPTATSAHHELPYYGKFLLIAAFLASHNPARTDPVFFMKMHEKKRKKMGGGSGYRGPGRPPKHRGITRKLLGPQPFPMERWLAIFHAVAGPADEYDDNGNGGKNERGAGKAGKAGGSGKTDGDATSAEAGSADLCTQVATLAALRLIVRASLTASPLDPAAKWRVNVGPEYVAALARSVRFEVADYLTEG